MPDLHSSTIKELIFDAYAHHADRLPNDAFKLLINSLLTKHPSKFVLLELIRHGLAFVFD